MDLFIVCGGFCITVAQLHSFERDHMACKVKSIYFWSFTRKVAQLLILEEG